MRASSLIVVLSSSVSAVIANTTFSSVALQASHLTEQVSNTTLTNLSTTHLLPGLNRNITAGAAWVYPSSPNDLGARDMSCECFDPNDQCCMPTSELIAPYCMLTGSICCGNTFCVVGESCCGGFCCASNTTCNLNIYTSGCCPIGSICRPLVTCYDASSTKCTNITTPAQQCCPAAMPYCRDFAPNGLGCYASSVMGKITSSTGMSAAPTSAILGLKVGTTGGTTMTSSHASIMTVTVSVVSNKSGGMSLEFPSLTEGTAGANQSTTYLLEYPSSDIPMSTPSSDTPLPGDTLMVMITGSDVYSTVYSTTSSSAAPTTPSSAKSSSSSNKSPLCFNTDLQTPAPCSSSITATTSGASSSSNGLPPGSSVVRSQASSNKGLPNTAWMLLIVIYILSGMVFGGILIYALMWLIRCVLKDPTPDTSNEDRISQDLRDFSSLDIKAVPGSGRRLSSASMLGREITVFRETARPYKEPMFVDKSRISMVEGSGHWTQGFLEKDPTSCTYTTYGTESGTPTTALAVGTNEQPQIGSGNLTLAMVVARDRDEKFAARRAELQDLAQLAQVVDDEGSPVRAGMKKRMVESESTSTLGHVFLRSRDNA